MSEGGGEITEVVTEMESTFGSPCITWAGGGWPQVVMVKVWRQQ